MGTNLIIKNRGTDKSMQIVYTSATTQYPILVESKYSADFLMKMADKLGVYIPKPIVFCDLKDMEIPKNILIDEGYDIIGAALDHYFGTHVVSVTLTDRVKEQGERVIDDWIHPHH